MGWGIETKLPINTQRDLSLVYTPGVGECCLKIKENRTL
jgi:malic enzyme